MIDSGGGDTLGEQVYRQNCTGCHGPDRKGNAAASIPTLVDLHERLSWKETLEVVTNGRAVMPPWGFLSRAQREAVVGYLLDMSENPPEPEPEVEVAGNEAKEEGWNTYVADEWTPGYEAPPYTHSGYNRFFDPDGYPAVKPPWGTLNAIDLNTGEYLWKVPLGEYPELIAKGIPPTGTENYGGPVVTAGGVLFIGASKDENFRVFDSKTGQELWRYKLPAAGYATPATYEVDGRQYVVIACGGGKIGTKSGDSYVAFALPE
jgi:quinoprotein glucose dehydrogenase